MLDDVKEEKPSGEKKNSLFFRVQIKISDIIIILALLIILILIILR